MDSKCAEDMMENAYECNRRSESNGPLMRCIPIALLCIEKSFEQLEEIVDAETGLTHHSPVVKKATAIYCHSILQQKPIDLIKNETQSLIKENTFDNGMTKQLQCPTYGHMTASVMRDI
jgi:ADP-ribosylglycohydrolase